MGTATIVGAGISGLACARALSDAGRTVRVLDRGRLVIFTALPDWVQSVGMVFSLILLMPSLGTAANGLLTFNGACLSSGTVIGASNEPIVPVVFSRTTTISTWPKRAGVPG